MSRSEIKAKDKSQKTVKSTTFSPKEHIKRILIEAGDLGCDDYFPPEAFKKFREASKRLKQE